MKKLNYLLWSILCAILFTACKGDEVDIPSTGIVLSVIDKGDELVDEANVYLFDSKDKFDAFILADSDDPALGTEPDLSSVIRAGLTIDGEVSFFNLTGDSDYWFYVRKDNTNNSKSQFKLESLTANATTYVLIKLEEFVTARVQFYSQDDNVSSNNVFIFTSENGIIGQTTSFEIRAPVSSSTPTEDDPVAVLFETDFGLNTFYIKNENGCVWQKEVNITPAAGIAKIELEACTTKEIKFSTSSTEDISIDLNNNEQIGSITNNSDLIIYRPEETIHTYKAVDSNGCTWIGQVTAGMDVNFDPVDADCK